MAAFKIHRYHYSWTSHFIGCYITVEVKTASRKKQLMKFLMFETSCAVSLSVCYLGYMKIAIFLQDLAVTGLVLCSLSTSLMGEQSVCNQTWEPRLLSWNYYVGHSCYVNICLEWVVQFLWVNEGSTSWNSVCNYISSCKMRTSWTAS
jgi:hypothetical protein